MKILTLRNWYLFTALACASLLGFAIFVQYQMFLDPCPLCIFQRVAFLWVGVFALLAALHYPRRMGRWIYAVAISVGAITGALIAGRHVYLQGLPPDQVPECGPGLNYMLDTLPFTDVLQSVLLGSGSCAEIQWTFLGLSMPQWTLAWFSGFVVVTLWMTFRESRIGQLS